MLHRLLTALALVTALAVPALAAAQPPTRAPGHVVELGEFDIVADVPWPAAIFIRRSEAGYDVVELRTSFVERVVESVDGPAF